MHFIALNVMEPLVSHSQTSLHSTQLWGKVWLYTYTFWYSGKNAPPGLFFSKPITIVMSGAQPQILRLCLCKIMSLGKSPGLKMSQSPAKKMPENPADDVCRLYDMTFMDKRNKHNLIIRALKGKPL